MNHSYQKALDEVRASETLKRDILSAIEKKRLAKAKALSDRRAGALLVCCLLVTLACFFIPSLSSSIPQGPNIPADSQTPANASSWVSSSSAPKSNVPAQALSRRQVSFSEAKQLFGWPLLPAAGEDFLGYVLLTTPASESCTLAYEFTYGSLRFSAEPFQAQDYRDYQTVEHRSHRFYVDGSAQNHVLVYSAAQYTVFAEIDGQKMTQAEAMELILSLAF